MLLCFNIKYLDWVLNGFLMACVIVNVLQKNSFLYVIKWFQISYAHIEGENLPRKSNGVFYENCDQRKYFKVLLPPCAKQFLNHTHVLRGRFSKWSKLLGYKMLWSRITSTLIVFPNDFSIGFKEEWTVPKDRPIYFMHGAIRMIRLGISSHDPPEPEGSTQGQSTR